MPTPSHSAVTLAQAQAIAETEHPESVAIASKTKLLQNKTTYVFTFVDNWKVAVRINDGTVVRVQDEAGKDQDCLNRHRELGVYP